MNISSDIYIAKLKNKLIGFVAVLPLPHPKPLRRIHRLVVLPEFQSIGIGTKLLTEVSKKYKNAGWTMTITTSNPGLMHSLNKKSNWKITGKGHKTNKQVNLIRFNKTSSIKRYTMSFKMV